MDAKDRKTSPTDVPMWRSEDAVAGLAMVRARVERCTQEEQDAFWEAVGRCFGGGKPPGDGLKDCTRGG